MQLLPNTHQWMLRGLYTAILSLPLCLHAQTTFPPLQGENVKGERIRVPGAASGTWYVVAVVCSKKAEPELALWFAPAYNRFVMKSGLFASTYPVELYLVPVFTGLDKAAYGPSMSALRKKVDADLAKQVIFFNGDESALLQALGIKDKAVPYFFTIAPDGTIAHRESGKFSVDKLDALEAPML